MAEKSNGEEKHTLISKHLILVLALLFALLVTEGLIFWMLKDDTTNLKDIMALTFGTFGTWIGAGAAYFFGRENMRTATESLLKMSGRTPTEILASTTLREMNPKSIKKTFKLSTPIIEVIDWLKKEVVNFFIPIVKDDGTFHSALQEEAVYRFIYDKIEHNTGKAFKTVEEYLKDYNLQSVIDFIEKEHKELRSLLQAALTLSEDIKASEANEKLEKAYKPVAIIVDAQNRPTGYITTADIRRLLTKES